MKRGFIVFFLCLCLILCSCPVLEASAADICFVAINDQLLELSAQPYFSGGVTYLPYWIFTNYGFNIYYTYFPEISSAMLYNTGTQLVFDLANGGAYDSGGKTYSAQAIERNGTVYVPATFVCSFFGGLSCSYVKGNEYGDVVRLKDSAAVLTDVQFVRAASQLMQNRYEAYTGGTAAVSPSVPSAEVPVDHSGTSAYISILGFPDAQTLSALSRYKADACFFLTADEIRAQPEMVRQLVCDGFKLGVRCLEDGCGDFDTASGLIFEAARVKTLMMTAFDSVSESCAAEALERGLVFCSFDFLCSGSLPGGMKAARLSDALENGTGNISVCISPDGGNEYSAVSVLSLLNGSGFDLRSPRETGG